MQPCAGACWHASKARLGAPRSSQGEHRHCPGSRGGLREALPQCSRGSRRKPYQFSCPCHGGEVQKERVGSQEDCGLTTLDVVHGNKLVAELTGADPEDVDVLVVGGHAGVTILPLFSQDGAAGTIPADKISALDKHVQDAGTDVVNSKNDRAAWPGRWATPAPVRQGSACRLERYTHHRGCVCHVLTSCQGAILHGQS